ncbi:YoaK family protein [Novosphingobium bradum]|uniref:YoaK family protein n=1 Tax=Novosphingobium bradum TaxID=1737444 RepID=A0ABV7IR20_9SPHN
MNRFDRRRQVLAIGLAGMAGYVDAVGFLLAGGYFVSFMSGNTTRLAVNLAGYPATALVPALLIAGFIGGVAAGSVVAARAGTRRKPAVLALVCALVTAAALANAAGHPGAAPALLVLAMGALNNTFQRGGDVAVGLTYMTGALVKLGQALGALLLGQRRAGWGAFLLLWSGLAIGAVLGALAWSHLAGGALWFAAGWGLAMLALSLRLAPEAA